MTGWWLLALLDVLGKGFRTILPEVSRIETKNWTVVSLNFSSQAE